MKRFAAVLLATILAAAILPLTSPADDPPAPTPKGNKRSARQPDATPATDQAPTTHPSAGTPNLYVTQFSQMNKELQLTQDQKTKLKALIDSMLAQTDEIRNAITKKIKEDNAAAFTKSGDERNQLLKQLHDDGVKEMANYDKLVADFQTKINALLTPDQRIAWETFKLYHLLSVRFAVADLTDAQAVQLKPLIDAAAKDLAATPDGPTASSAISGRLIRRIVAEVLTEEQAAKFALAPVHPFGLPSGPASGPAKPPAKPAKDPGLP